MGGWGVVVQECCTDVGVQRPRVGPWGRSIANQSATPSTSNVDGAMFEYATLDSGTVQRGHSENGNALPRFEPNVASVRATFNGTWVRKRQDLDRCTFNQRSVGSDQYIWKAKCLDFAKVRYVNTRAGPSDAGSLRSTGTLA